MRQGKKQTGRESRPGTRREEDKNKAGRNREREKEGDRKRQTDRVKDRAG